MMAPVAICRSSRHTAVTSCLIRLRVGTKNRVSLMLGDRQIQMKSIIAWDKSGRNLTEQKKKEEKEPGLARCHDGQGRALAGPRATKAVHPNVPWILPITNYLVLRSFMRHNQSMHILCGCSPHLGITNLGKKKKKLFLLRGFLGSLIVALLDVVLPLHCTPASYWAAFRTRLRALKTHSGQ